MISFNKPYLTGKETHYIYDAVNSGKISGNGKYTQKCQSFFESKWGFKKTLLTTSCTDALEMCALLLNIQLGDEVIVPTYTFVSTALAFVRQGATIKFADSRSDRPGIDEDRIESLITHNTKAIVVVHYAGVACDMDKVMAVAKKYNLYVIEDAAQAIDSFYTSPRTGLTKALGTIGHFGCFSFHETKNIQCGEGGLLAVNDDNFIKRAEIIWEKGTNRAEFFRGEVNKYGWKDIGSSFLPSDVLAAFLFAQLEELDKIQAQRKHNWELYFDLLLPLSKKNKIKLPVIPKYATNNGHMFYLQCDSIEERRALIEYLKAKGIYSVFHYLCLHKSDYYLQKYNEETLEHAEKYEGCLLRLPFFYELNQSQIKLIVDAIETFYV